MYEERYGAGATRGAFAIAYFFLWSIWGKLSLLLMAVGISVTLLLLLGCAEEKADMITFVSDRDGDPEIFVMNVDGTDQTPITRNGAVDERPLWSPDKRYVAYVSEESGDREINRVEIGNKEAVTERLTHAPGPDDSHYWSPDGSRLAFISNRDGQPEIYLMNANGSNFTRVTFDPSNPRLSDWSPDGQWLAFTLQGEGVGPGVVTRNPDGINVRPLTIDADQNAAWSPDGRKLVFTSLRDEGQEIYIMNSDGSGQTRLTHNPTPDYQPSWSPNGKSLVFVSERDGNPEIYVMKADGSTVTRLTYNEARDEWPVWSPDGSRIVFVSYMYGTSEIIVMDADGDHQIRLTNNNANDTQPSW